MIKNFLTSILAILFFTLSLLACVPKTKTYKVQIQPLRVEIRAQQNNFLIERIFPPDKINTANGEIINFYLGIKDRETNKPVEGVLVQSNLVDFLDVVKTDKYGITLFSEPIGDDGQTKDKSRISKYGKITRERMVYPRFWVIDEKDNRISEKFEIPIKILKNREVK